MNKCYPYPIESKHRRQSMVDNVHKPDLEKYPLFDDVVCQQGIIHANDALYIPFGWWHQIECQHQSISLSIRWNPYTHILKQAFHLWQRANPLLKDIFFTQCLENCHLPVHVKQLAFVWKDCWLHQLLHHSCTKDTSLSRSHTSTSTVASTTCNIDEGSDNDIHEHDRDDDNNDKKDDDAKDTFFMEID
ncbi:hypothetical protein RFI_16902 [Reticulomyxa filosa]|uniref:JmjC domain-containing protein n=2 Tax=Reticulomyxa filosa TaxID=46433 RepID=X6N3I3_RETFI|nr:hypothetical protein RFI_16902 [Reticulomyxa filosa]|eukprot:ETO20314.1 hypothetical protein RFI_16902 [Reticulomyxa filosa]